MAYTPREIKDRVAVGDDIFIVEDLGDNRIRLIPAPTHVSEPGTPVNKALLQPIEDFLATLGTGGLVPPGAIIMWSGAINNIPVGWALCDGSNGTPDLRDRFIVGAGGNYNVGNTGGSNTVTLTTSQIPSHRHTASISQAGDHSHGMGTKWLMTGSGSEINPGTNGPDYFATTHERTTGQAGAHSHSITISSTGGGGAHENRPPYYALAYIMKL
jgi:microcystin-dependent protein